MQAEAGSQRILGAFLGSLNAILVAVRSYLKFSHKEVDMVRFVSVKDFLSAISRMRWREMRAEGNHCINKDADCSDGK